MSGAGPDATGVEVVAESPDASAPRAGPATERREPQDAIVIVGTDAVAVGRAARDAGVAAPGRRVIAFVGASDDPARAEMVGELLGE